MSLNLNTDFYCSNCAGFILHPQSEERSMVKDCSLGRWLAEAALTRHWCDVTLQASGREYRAHRVVLSCASPFIRVSYTPTNTTNIKKAL